MKNVETEAERYRRRAALAELHLTALLDGAYSELPQSELGRQALRVYAHASLNQLGEKEELRAARSLYWYLFYACALLALLVDLLRLCGLSTAVGDALLGFRSAAGEARRFRPLLLALVPLCHGAFASLA